MTQLNFLMEVFISLPHEQFYHFKFYERNQINLDFGGSIADYNVAGPLVEYERRIAAGELVDGDSCQVRPPVSPASSSFIFRDESELYME